MALSVTDAVLPLTVGAKVGTFAPELTRVTWKDGVPTRAVGQLYVITGWYRSLLIAAWLQSEAASAGWAAPPARQASRHSAGAIREIFTSPLSDL